MTIRISEILLVSLLVIGCWCYEGDEDDTVMPNEKKKKTGKGEGEDGSDYSMLDNEWTAWEDQKVRTKFNMSSMTVDEAKVIAKNLKHLNDVIGCIKFTLWKKGDTGRFVMFTKKPEGTKKTATTYFEVPEDPNMMKVVIKTIDITDDPFLNMVIKHESLHTLGLGHTTRRNDRDQYITINWQNIPKDKYDQYQKCDECETLGIPYDCRSIMHYRGCRYGIPCNDPVFSAKDPAKCDLDTLNTEMTENDIAMTRKINCGPDRKKGKVGK